MPSTSTCRGKACLALDSNKEKKVVPDQIAKSMIKWYPDYKENSQHRNLTKYKRFLTGLHPFYPSKWRDREDKQLKS